MKKIIVVLESGSKMNAIKDFLADLGIKFEMAENPERKPWHQLSWYFIVSERGYNKYAKKVKEAYWDDVGNVYNNFNEYLDWLDKWESKRSKTKNFSDLEVYREDGHISRSCEYILIRNNVTSEELLHMTDEEIKSLRGVGKKKFEELVNFIAWLAWKKFN